MLKFTVNCEKTLSYQRNDYDDDDDDNSRVEPLETINRVTAADQDGRIRGTIAYTSKLQTFADHGNCTLRVVTVRELSIHVDESDERICQQLVRYLCADLADDRPTLIFVPADMETETPEYESEWLDCLLEGILSDVHSLAPVESIDTLRLLSSQVNNAEKLRIEPFRLSISSPDSHHKDDPEYLFCPSFVDSGLHWIAFMTFGSLKANFDMTRADGEYYKRKPFVPGFKPDAHWKKNRRTLYIKPFVPFAGGFRGRGRGRGRGSGRGGRGHSSGRGKTGSQPARIWYENPEDRPGYSVFKSRRGRWWTFVGAACVALIGISWWQKLKAASWIVTRNQTNY